MPLVFLTYLPHGYRVLHGGGVGVAKDTGSAFWGPVGQARVGSGSRRKGHSEVAEKLPLPAPAPTPPYPSFKGEHWGGELQSQRPAACPGCGGQSRPWHWAQAPSPGQADISTLPLPPAPSPGQADISTPFLLPTPTPSSPL